MRIDERLKLRELSEEAARETSTWKYNAPYEVYSSWSWEKMVEVGESITDPKQREEKYLGFFNDEDEVLGFVVFNVLEGNLTRIGLGLKPDSCGRGLGEQFTELIVQECKRRNPENIIDLEVLSWNKRALKVYERSGFKIMETYTRKTPTGEAEFHRMEYMGDK